MGGNGADFRTRLRHGGCVGGCHEDVYFQDVWCVVGRDGVRGDGGGIGGMRVHAEAADARVEEPPQVPAAMMYQDRWHGGTGYALASDVLPTAGTMEVFVPRFYPVAYGPIQLGGVSGYRIYTYDSQAISTLGNTGWRTRYLEQTGITVP